MGRQRPTSPIDSEGRGTPVHTTPPDPPPRPDVFPSDSVVTRAVRSERFRLVGALVHSFQMHPVADA